MRTVRGVVRARRDELHGVSAEDGQVPDVLLPYRQRPSVIGIGLGPVTQLVTTKGILGRCCRREAVRQTYGSFLHLQCSKQAPYSEEDAAGVIAGNEDRGRRCGFEGADTVPFRRRL